MAAEELDFLLGKVVNPGAIYLHRKVAGLRKSINDLVLITEQEKKLTPMSPALVEFCNR